MSARERLTAYIRRMEDGELTFEDRFIPLSVRIDGVEAEAVEAYRVQGSGSVIYFAERDGLIKIGTSTQVAARLANIARGASMPKGMEPGPVNLLGTVPGDRRLERDLHLCFLASRVGRSEWFTDSPELRDWIRENAG